MSDELEIITDHTGEERRLGRTLPDEDGLTMRAGMPGFAAMLAEKGLALIPREQWKPVDRRGTLGTNFINNQMNFGACVGGSGVQAFMRDVALRGGPFNKLSWGFLYDQINGGRDNGAIITRAMTALEQIGTCLESEYPKPVFNRRLQPDSIKRFRLVKALTLSTFDEMATALQMGFIVQFPVQVGQNFQRFNSDGCAGVDRGSGNHSVHADSLLQLSSGEWVFRMPNSWGTAWGPFKDGTVLLRQASIDGCAVGDDAYCHMATLSDPQDKLPDIAV